MIFLRANKRMKQVIYRVFVLLITLSSSTFCYAQVSDQDSLSFFEFPTEIHKPRLIGLSTAVGVGYVATSVGLYNTWYSEFPRTNFHLFNDLGEWQNMDKFGHVFTAYFQGIMGYKMSRWTGLPENQAILIGAVAGSLFQTTVEVMDGFSSKWGFSLSDMAANVIGSAAFVFQQKAWGEQRIQLKISSWPEEHPDALISSDIGWTTNLTERADFLFGKSFLERFLKDYNAQTYWLSANVSSFSRNSHVPKWLNLALGFSSENLYGGFENTWELNATWFDANDEFPRQFQFLLGLDVDFTKIKTKKHFLKAILTALNMYRFPFPAIELNTSGELHFHLIFKN